MLLTHHPPSIHQQRKIPGWLEWGWVSGKYPAMSFGKYTIIHFSLLLLLNILLGLNDGSVLFFRRKGAKLKLREELRQNLITFSQEVIFTSAPSTFSMLGVFPLVGWLVLSSEDSATSFWIIYSPVLGSLIKSNVCAMNLLMRRRRISCRVGKIRIRCNNKFSEKLKKKKNYATFKGLLHLCHVPNGNQLTQRQSSIGREITIGVADDPTSSSRPWQHKLSPESN